MKEMKLIIVKMMLNVKQKQCLCYEKKVNRGKPLNRCFLFHFTSHSSVSGKVIIVDWVGEGKGTMIRENDSESEKMRWKKKSLVNEKKISFPHVVQRVFHATWMNFSLFPKLLLNISLNWIVVVIVFLFH